jgi:hypothetical protein
MLSKRFVLKNDYTKNILLFTVMGIFEFRSHNEIYNFDNNIKLDDNFFVKLYRSKNVK